MLKVASSQGADEQNEFGKICLKIIEEAKKVFTLPANEKEKLVCDETSQNFYQGILKMQRGRNFKGNTVLTPSKDNSTPLKYQYQ